MSIHVRRFEKLLPDGITVLHRVPWGNILRRIGTREELTASGFAPAYMFDAMGRQKSMRSSDEFGDTCHISTLKSGRFKVERWLNRDAYEWVPDNDISDILARITNRTGGAA